VAAALDPDDRALFDAARANDAAAVKALLAKGAVHVDARTVRGQWEHTPAGDTPLVQACKKGAGDAALALLDGGADPKAVNQFEQSALLWAARSKLGAVVSRCLARGADVNLADSAGETPLLYAAQNGDEAMVDELLRAGARAEAKTRSGVTAADRAGFHGHLALMRRLRDLAKR
jgi:ankyrin repeat protein